MRRINREKEREVVSLMMEGLRQNSGRLRSDSFSDYHLSKSQFYTLRKKALYISSYRSDSDVRYAKIVEEKRELEGAVEELKASIEEMKKEQAARRKYAINTYSDAYESFLKIAASNQSLRDELSRLRKWAQEHGGHV